ncbi:unnamed protein product [Parnassius apollo]|uniref:(apollo) hypothetical protein n=1 Tax=Parnassius apollo TaxID=110799 RepID=A0A8S3Y502_PARAO|nr:unnamed protein product [Parnassius apollo]
MLCLKCGCRKHGLKCTNLCSNCHSSEQCINVQKKIYEEVNDSDEIADEEPMQTENNVGDEDNDGLEDVQDLESERPVEFNDQEIPSKRQKLMNK